MAEMKNRVAPLSHHQHFYLPARCGQIGLKPAPVLALWILSHGFRTKFKIDYA
jgi:hypothetical protein